MGHQVNFYLDENDTKGLEYTFENIGEFLVLHSRAPDATPKVVEGLNTKENGQPWLFFYLVRPADLGSVVTRHVPLQGYWTVDVLESPVIEFNKCYFDGKILRRGRVYYVDGFYDSNRQWKEKPEQFRHWAKNILTRTKKELKKYRADYVGSSAEAWLVSSGGKLV